jgi:hypothetical protein
MSVNLSPLGGAGAQFFSNNGVPLAGGLLYTYLAGTTTPAVTYTSSSGVTPLANPIVLDSAGRVPTGEIWLTDTISYKFVLKSATDVLIATWDQLPGINSNIIGFTAQQQTITATASQTVFNLSITYVPNTNNLAVFVNGLKQIVGVNYLETDSDTVTFLSGVTVGSLVQFSTATPVASNVATSNNVSYTPAGASAVVTDVQTKLRESVSVKDFGAVGDGSTDDTAAIVAALAASNSVYFPAGTYMTTGNINIKAKNIFGAGAVSSTIKLLGSNTNASLFINGGNISTSWGTGGGCTIRGLSLQGNWDGATTNSVTDISSIGGLVKWWAGAYIKIYECNLSNCFGFGFFCYKMGYSDIHDCHIYTNAKNGVHVEAPNGDDAITSSSINQTSVNSCRGTGDTGGKGIYIKNGFFFNVNSCTIEDVDIGVYLDGIDNRNITVFETHTETTTTAGIKYAGSGYDLMLFQNVIASSPYFVQTNPEFQTYVAIGNFGIPDVYALPISLAASQEVQLTNATPSKTLNQITLQPGTWLITASWIGVTGSGVGQMSTRQEFGLNDTAALPAYSSSYSKARLRGDCTSTINTGDGFINGTLSYVQTLTSATTIYLYGGATSITSSLAVAVSSYIKAVQVNGAYL